MYTRDMKIFAIGVYGFAEDASFAAFKELCVASLIDVRRRCGVCGAGYAPAACRRSFQAENLVQAEGLIWDIWSWVQVSFR